MQDEEYPAYLKTQSAEDLVSISYSIDKDAQPKRYEMVLAELAERKKRGERTGKKTSYHYVFLAFGLLSATAGLIDLYTGTAYTRGHHEILLSQDPGAYWVNVSLHFVTAGILLWIGYRNRNDDA